MVISPSEQRLRSVFQQVFALDPGHINEETSIDSVESWDSLNHMKLILALESEFNIAFSDEHSVEILSYPLIKLTLAEYGVAFG